MKRLAKQEQEAVERELGDARGEEAGREQQLQDRLQEVRAGRKQVDEEIDAVDSKASTVISDADYETNQMQLRISQVEDRIRNYQKQMAITKKLLETFEAQAEEELSGRKQELEKAEKARNSANLLATAAQRNLDSFAASLRSIESSIPGGANPRQRIAEKEEGGKLKTPRPKSTEKSETGA